MSSSPSNTLPPVPAAAKFIQPLISRSIELSTHDPIMSYFCKLHAVQQILAKNLHLESKEVEVFATDLLDNIEQIKDSASETTLSVINDDVTGQAYVEDFALKVFIKADKEIRSKRTNKTTANTFLAASSFLDCLKIFQSPLEKDINDKIKYSKYHAARIMKAYKSGEDPNDYDVPEDEEEEQEDDLEGLQAEGEGEGFDSVTEGVVGEEVPIEGTQPISDANQRERQVSIDDELQDLDLQSEPNEINDNRPPSSLSLTPNPLNLPSAPPVLPSAPPLIPSAPQFPSAPVSFTPGSSTIFPTIPISRPQIPSPSPQPPTTRSAPPPPAPQPTPPRRISQPTNNVHHSPSLSKADVQTILDQTEIISTAQKHSKFAISALNYDDIPTAIKELKAALTLLENSPQ